MCRQETGKMHLHQLKIVLISWLQHSVFHQLDTDAPYVAREHSLLKLLNSTYLRKDVGHSCPGRVKKCFKLEAPPGRPTML